jgi:hypothetical protein
VRSITHPKRRAHLWCFIYGAPAVLWQGGHAGGLRQARYSQSVFELSPHGLIRGAAAGSAFGYPACPVSITDSNSIAGHLRDEGFAWASAEQLRALLPPAALRDWKTFAASWNDLGVDIYMADNGRYRRRRFGAFAVSAHGIVRKPHQPHYQSRDYNPLNGGVERWFQPLLDSIADHVTLRSIFEVCFSTFQGLTPLASRPASWHVECHQFRIEARVGEPGKPTPEGLHRDGVDWVLVMLVARVNIAEGVTSIHDTAQRLLGRFTLTEPLDCAFVDDSRVYHGVTPVVPIDSALPAFRDVLVVTFRRE